METKVISARVPVDVAKMFENACKQRGLSKSKYLGEIITTPLPVATSTMAAGGEIEIPDDVADAIAVVGGAGVGLLVYKALKTSLPDDKFTSAEKEIYSSILAIGAAFLSGYGIHKLVK